MSGSLGGDHDDADRAIGNSLNKGIVGISKGLNRWFNHEITFDYI